MQVIPLSAEREIHIQKKDWKGKQYVDIRTYIKTEDYVGYTQKGVMIPLEKVRDIQDGLLRELQTNPP